jgi:L-ascorbate metabolism protein UlaG (beta-lactamase superfamily)
MKRPFAVLLVMSSLPLLAAAQAPAASGAGKTELTWYGHAAFTLKTPKGTVLAIDPWFSNPSNKDGKATPPEKIDFILVTHGHSDHVGDAVALATKTHAKFVGAFELAQALVSAGYPAEQATMATSGNMGGTLQLTDEVAVTLVPAIHSSGFKKDPQSPTEYGGNPVGFVIKVKGGPTIYHTGDTAPFSDMQLFAKRRGPIDVMLACIGGHFTMDPVGAALAASFVKPKQIVPMHFGTFPVMKGTPDELRQALRQRGVNTKVAEMKVGETQTLHIAKL